MERKSFHFKPRFSAPIIHSVHAEKATSRLPPAGIPIVTEPVKNRGPSFRTEIDGDSGNFFFFHLTVCEVSKVPTVRLREIAILDNITCNSIKFHICSSFNSRYTPLCIWRDRKALIHYEFLL